MTTGRPVFAVIGHTTEGKSSIVSSVAADDLLRIPDTGRTTRKCRPFPVQIDGETVVELMDTPGVENA